MEDYSPQMTIRQFATLVLANETIKHALEQFNAERRVTDLFIDSCQGMLDANIIKLETTNEEVAHKKVIADMERFAGSMAYTRLKCTLDDEQKKKHQREPTTRDGIVFASLYRFSNFCDHDENMRFLVFGVSPFKIKGTNGKDVTLLDVFSLYLWIYMKDPFTSSEYDPTHRIIVSKRIGFLNGYNHKIVYNDDVQISKSSMILAFDYFQWGMVKFKDGYENLEVVGDYLMEYLSRDPGFGEPLAEVIPNCAVCNRVWTTQNSPHHISRATSLKGEEITLCNISACRANAYRHYEQAQKTFL